MEGKYIQFSTGDDSVSHQNGLEPVTVRKRISSINTCNICIRDLIEYSQMECKYIQFSTGDDGVPCQNGLERVTVRKEIQQYQQLRHSSMFT